MGFRFVFPAQRVHARRKKGGVIVRFSKSSGGSSTYTQRPNGEVDGARMDDALGSPVKVETVPVSSGGAQI